MIHLVIPRSLPAFHSITEPGRSRRLALSALREGMPMDAQPQQCARQAGQQYRRPEKQREGQGLVMTHLQGPHIEDQEPFAQPPTRQGNGQRQE